MPSPRTGPGDLERAVMDVLWQHVPETPRPADGLTVREVHEHLAARNLAYTTVMTVLDRLSKKDLVHRRRDGRAWRYTPAATRGELTAVAMRTPLAPLAAPERRAALMHFLDAASPEEIDELRAALRRLEAHAGESPPRPGP